MATKLYIDQDQIPLGAFVKCDGCETTFLATLAEPCDDAILTPGDPVPAGRCYDSHCGALVYLTPPLTVEETP